jgi:hypothetical protein
MSGWDGVEAEVGPAGHHSVTVAGLASVLRPSGGRTTHALSEGLLGLTQRVCETPTQKYLGLNPLVETLMILYHRCKETLLPPGMGSAC